MADIRCSHCGKNNPDFLDVCQFCQSPLKPESMLHIGQQPTKKNTGELEEILPDWLKSARQQARDSAEQESSFPTSQTKPKKEEPVDLLAGLFQSDTSEEEDVPDWLSSIHPNVSGKAAAPPAQPEPESDFFAQFKTSDTGSKSEPPRETFPVPSSEPAQPPQAFDQHDELSDWFAQASEQPTQEFSLDRDSSLSHSDWGISDLGQTRAAESPPPKEEEDLSWLHNLENAARKTDELKPPKPTPNWEQEFTTPSTSSEPEDLSWLDNLGALPGTEQYPAQPVQPSQPPEDLSWLDALGGGSTLAAAESPQENLDWLNNLGGTPIRPTPAQTEKPEADLSWLDAFKQPESPQSAPAPQESSEDLSWLTAFSESNETQPPTAAPSSSASDLDWLNDLGSTAAPEPSTPASSTQDDLGWLNNLQGGESEALSAAPFAQPVEDQNPEEIPHVSPFMPRKTAPLEGEASDFVPDWLKSATEEPSMPMGTSALDQFREDYRVPTGSEDPFSWKSFTQEPEPAEDQPALSSFFQAQDQPELTSPGSLSSIPSTEEVNSLFSMEMPDWLSQAESTKQEEPAQSAGIHAEDGEALAPVDLPSWVQAMRPMDAVISEAAPTVDDQPTEREGPLAGFKGLIPVSPVGSARRPKPISLKLQASDEQQAGAAILEQILAAETSARPIVSTPSYAPQRTLRWALTILFLLVLIAMIALQPQVFPPSAALTADSTEIGARLQGLPANADVLVVVDYEAATAGELEAVSAPMLEQLALLRRPRLSFVSTSPNGPALVEKLMSNPAIKQTSDGLGGYIGGQDYHNLGYLPGAESGVLTFIQAPRSALPASATLDVFSGYSAVILLTDNADSARLWIEQLQAVKQRDAALALQPLLVASSAQAGPMLQPYAASGQINGLVAGLADASRYEYQNTSRPGIALSYLDAFGAGLLLAVTLIVLGNLWNILVGIRARRAEAAEG